MDCRALDTTCVKRDMLIKSGRAVAQRSILDGRAVEILCGYLSRYGKIICSRVEHEETLGVINSSSVVNVKFDGFGC